MKIDYKYLELLDEIAEELIDCGLTSFCFAGGCIRDMLLEKPIKDIDIFYCEDIDEEKLNKTFDTSECKEISYYGDTEFKLTHSGLNYGGLKYPIQLIRLEGNTGVLGTFPVGISKVAYWPDGTGLEISADFINDTRFKVLSFTEECSEEYQERIRAKYPDYF